MPSSRALAKGTQGPLADPEALWEGAAEAAREHGVFPTAKVLRLEYGKLKQKAEAGPVTARPSMSPATFAELMPPQGVDLGECLIELEGPRGKMRIQVETGERAGLGRTQPGVVGVGVIQIAPQMRIPVAIEAVSRTSQT